MRKVEWFNLLKYWISLLLIYVEMSDCLNYFSLLIFIIYGLSRILNKSLISLIIKLISLKKLKIN